MNGIEAICGDITRVGESLKNEDEPHFLKVFTQMLDDLQKDLERLEGKQGKHIDLESVQPSRYVHTPFKKELVTVSAEEAEANKEKPDWVSDKASDLIQQIAGSNSFEYMERAIKAFEEFLLFIPKVPIELQNANKELRELLLPRVREVLEGVSAEYIELVASRYGKRCNYGTRAVYLLAHHIFVDNTGALPLSKEQLKPFVAEALNLLLIHNTVSSIGAPDPGEIGNAIEGELLQRAFEERQKRVLKALGRLNEIDWKLEDGFDEELVKERLDLLLKLLVWLESMTDSNIFRVVISTLKDCLEDPIWKKEFKDPKISSLLGIVEALWFEHSQKPDAKRWFDHIEKTQVKVD